MTKQQFRLFCLAASLAFVAPQSVISSEADGTQLALSDVRIEGVALSLEPEVPGTFTLPFRVVNNSRLTIELNEFRVRFLVSPGVFVHSPHDGGSGTRRPESIDCSFEQGAVAPGSTRFAYCDFQSSTQLESFADVLGLVSDWRTLTLTPAQFQVFSEAQFKTYIDSEDESLVKIHSISLVTPINLRPTIWQVIAGAFLGASLLAMFIMTRNYQPTDLQGAPLFWHILREGTQFLVLLVSGWLASSIVIFVTYRMHDAGFPISLSISDFYGGVVVGLFGYIAASWIQDKFLAVSRTEGDTGGTQPP